MRGAILIVAVVLWSAAAAQEVAVPMTLVPATVTDYRVTGFSQQREPDVRFCITYRDNNGRVYTDEHHGPSSRPNPLDGQPVVLPEGADAFLKQLNTANFSTTSLTKRLLQHLVQHGKIPASTVTGEAEK